MKIFGTLFRVSQCRSQEKDVLHIDAYNVASTNKTDSVALKNAKKLRLIDKPLIDKPYSEELLLTRTRK